MEELQKIIDFTIHAQHLVCTLCMGYFKDACTIIECLHTFCRGVPRRPAGRSNRGCRMRLASRAPLLRPRTHAARPRVRAGAGCIMRHFSENNFCPQCDSRLGTNPKDLVRTDRTLQSIVDKVFPQFAQSSGKHKHHNLCYAKNTGSEHSGGYAGNEF